MYVLIYRMVSISKKEKDKLLSILSDTEEPKIKPIRLEGMTNLYKCGSCERQVLSYEWLYCPRCGYKVNL